MFETVCELIPEEEEVLDVMKLLNSIIIRH